MKYAVYAALLVCFFFSPRMTETSAAGEEKLKTPEQEPAEVIVIDPGHGGWDSGATGPGGVEEKNITLKMALKVAERLRRTLGCRVLLTRTDDTFVPLTERTAFANSSKADIFISIHTNSTISREVNGVETFFLSFDATDEEARRLALFENSSMNGPGDRDSSDPKAAEDLKDILWDLNRTESHHESSRLAESIQNRLLFATGEENRGVKQAPFIVLEGASMPAVLVEVGFISNPDGEKKLSSGKVQDRIAESIVSGVTDFKKILQGRDYIEQTTQKN